MINLSIVMGIFLIFGTALLGYLIFSRCTIQVLEQSESFLMSFGRLVRSYQKPGLKWVPAQILPWTKVLTVSKQIDYRIYKNINVNDKFGTTLVVDLWLEFRITDPYKALFKVEQWEEVLQSIVVHSTAANLANKSVDKILKHRTELAEQLKTSIENETERWGITILGAMIQNIGLLPEVSKHFFQSVAARIERTKAFIEEEGRLKVAKLEASTSLKIAELTELANCQTPLEIGKFYQNLSADPILVKKFKEYWELSNLDPRKMVTFQGVYKNQLEILEGLQVIDNLTENTQKNEARFL